MISKIGKIVALFPGQGSQHIGMGHKLFQTFTEAREVFGLVDDALQQNLSQLMFAGDVEELILTRNAQPSIMAVSLAIATVLTKQSNKLFSEIFSVAAGHSLGEYSALAAAGSLSVAETAKLLRIRGAAMQDAVAPNAGAMVALIGASIASATQLCERASEFGVCCVANDNNASQVVLSGHAGAIDYAISIASDFGIKKAIRLKVSAPFHSSLMQPAALKMKQALSQVDIAQPQVDVIANYTVERHTQETTKQLLVDQVIGRVRWRETMEKLHNEYSPSLFIEIGPEQVLSGIAKRMYPEVPALSLHDPYSIEEFTKLIT